MQKRKNAKDPTKEGPILVLLLILISSIFFLDTSSVGKGIEDIFSYESCTDITPTIDPTGEKIVYYELGLKEVKILGNKQENIKCLVGSTPTDFPKTIEFRSGILPGSDNDNDGVLGTIIITYSAITINDPTTNPTKYYEIAPSPTTESMQIDPNDQNPCVPMPNISVTEPTVTRRPDGGFDVYSSITICSTTNTTNQVNRTTPATYPQNISNVPTGNFRNTKDNDLDGVTQIEIEFGTLVITGDPNLLGNWKHFENTNYQAQNAPDLDDTDNSNPVPKIISSPTITPYPQCNGIDSARLVLTSGQVKYKGQNYPETQITHDTTCLTSGQLPTAKYTVYSGTYTFGPDNDNDGIASTISFGRTNYWIDKNGIPQNEPAAAETIPIDPNDNDNSNPIGYFETMPSYSVTPNCAGTDTIRITFNSGRYKQNGQYYPAAPITQDTGCANAGILPYTTPAYLDIANPIPTAVDADNDGIAGQYRIAQRTTTIPKTNPTNVQHAPANPLIAQGPDLDDNDPTFPKPAIDGPYAQVALDGPGCTGIDTIYLQKVGGTIKFKQQTYGTIVENQCINLQQLPKTFIIPTGIISGADADNDGFYANYAITQSQIVVNKDGTISGPTPTNDGQTIPIDPNDNDNSNPLPVIDGPYYDVFSYSPTCQESDQIYVGKLGAKIIFKGQTYGYVIQDQCIDANITIFPKTFTFPTGIKHGPDNDKDGFFEYYIIKQSQITLNEYGYPEGWGGSQMIKPAPDFQIIPGEDFGRDNNPDCTPLKNCNAQYSPILQFSDGFEDGILSPFTSEGSSPQNPKWTVSNLDSETGTYSAMAVDPRNYYGQLLELTVSATGSASYDAVPISFAYKITDGPPLDEIRFCINTGNYCLELDYPSNYLSYPGKDAVGTDDYLPWLEFTGLIHPGTYTFYWGASNDWSLSQQYDDYPNRKLWIDNVRIWAPIKNPTTLYFPDVCTVAHWGPVSMGGDYGPCSN